jgi:WD40 repeat protein
MVRTGASGVVEALVQEVLSEMVRDKLKTLAALLLTFALVGGMTLALLYPAVQADQPPAVAAGKEPLKIRLGGNPLESATLEFALDGKTLRGTIATWKKEVAFFPDQIETRYWEIPTGKEWKSAQGEFRSDGVLGNRAFVDKSRVVDRSTGKDLSQITLPAGSRLDGPTLFAPDGKSLILTVTDAPLNDPTVNWLDAHESLLLFDTTTGKMVKQFGPGYDLIPTDFSPDGKAIYISRAVRPGGGFTFAALDLAGGKKEFGRYFLPRNRPWLDRKFLNIDGRLSPDGKLLVILGAVEQDRDSVLHLFDTATGQKSGEIKGHTTKATVFSPLTGDPEKIDRSGILCFTFAASGKTLLTGGEDGVVCLRDVASGKVLGQYTGHRDRQGPGPVAILSVAVTSDNRRVASIDDKGNLHVWEMAQ